MIRTIGIVSLSSGVIGESFVRHEVDIGLERLRAAGLRVRFMPPKAFSISRTTPRPGRRI